jgi:hypothetical protein
MIETFITMEGKAEGDYQRSKATSVRGGRGEGAWMSSVCERYLSTNNPAHGILRARGERAE